MLAPQKVSIFGCSCRLWLLSWRRARIFARSCSLLSKYLPISWKQRKEQSHAQCHVTHRIRIFDKISEHVKVAKSVDIAVPELAVTKSRTMPKFCRSFPQSLRKFSSDPQGKKNINEVTLGTRKRVFRKKPQKTNNGKIFQSKMVLKFFDKSHCAKKN